MVSAMTEHAAPLDPALAERLDRDGYLMLRGAFAGEVEAVRRAFDEGVLASHLWPSPRGPDWRHALVDLDPTVRATCRAPALIAAVRHRLTGPFFLTQVEGREPLMGGGHQPLHRDGEPEDTGRMVSALLYLDDYGPANGATRVAAGSHRSRSEPDEGQAVVLQGVAGDILVFDINLLHGATRNVSGARRRSFLATYMVEALEAQHAATRELRGVRMSEVEWFA